MPSIETNGLTKRFAALTAVDHLSFNVKSGEIFGLLGPNGAGKTTTIRMLASLISPTEGYAIVNGHDVVKGSQKVRETVGILTENPSLYDRLTAQENMDFFAKAYGITDRVERVNRIKELLDFFDLMDRKDDKAGNFSKGMKQKLAIARALVHRPEVLFLDEPTSGLDPKSSKNIRDLMEKLSRQDKQTILLSTHRLEDADRLCSRVMIIKDGRSVIVGSPEKLRRSIIGTPVIEIHLQKIDEFIIRNVEAIEQVFGVSQSDNNNRMIVSIRDVKEGTPLVVKSIVEAGGMILSVKVVEPSLEEAYLKIIEGDHI